MIGSGSKRRTVARRCSGSVLAEGAAVVALFLPILVFLIMVVIEATNAYLIDRDLQIAAGMAARAIAQAGTFQAGQEVTQDLILSKIKIPNRVVDPSQFSPPPVYDFSSNPPTVTVFVQYKSTGIQPVPPFPDPLKLGNLFIIKAQATYRIQS